jgi:spermidine synthase
MYRYHGVLVYQSHDDDGVLEIIEREGVRSLHFGSFSRQSSMRLDAPDSLELEYVRTLTRWLLFKPELTGQTLLIGLGGGSISKFLWQHFPNCQLRVIEYRDSVVKIAQSHFALPKDARMKIIIDDGGKYVLERQESQRQQYELMIVDAFDHDGMAASTYHREFFDACQALLTRDGILAINLWGGTGNPIFQQVALWLGQVFDWRILFIPVQGRGNIIGLAFNKAVPTYAMADLKVTAKHLAERYQIDFPKYLKEIKKHNSSTLKTLIN